MLRAVLAGLWTLRLHVVYITATIVLLFSELLILFTAKQLVC
jgi:hypothetical protein